jgi:hypothetical protein
VYEHCVADCIDRGWTEERPGLDDNRFRSREYVKADLYEAALVRIADLEMALR